jgi:hypothetical protein
MVHTTVHALASASSRSLRHRDSAVTLSSPLVGSSRNSSSGLVSSSMATHSRLRSPPEMPFFSGVPTITSCALVRPICAMTVLMRSWRASRLMLRGSRSSAVYCSVSSTVRLPFSRSSCMT